MGAGMQVCKEIYRLSRVAFHRFDSAVYYGVVCIFSVNFSTFPGKNASQRADKVRYCELYLFIVVENITSGG